MAIAVIDELFESSENEDEKLFCANFFTRMEVLVPEPSCMEAWFQQQEQIGKPCSVRHGDADFVSLSGWTVLSYLRTLLRRIENLGHLKWIDICLKINMHFVKFYHLFLR